MLSGTCPTAVACIEPAFGGQLQLNAPFFGKACCELNCVGETMEVCRDASAGISEPTATTDVALDEEGGTTSEMALMTENWASGDTVPDVGGAVVATDAVGREVREGRADAGGGSSGKAPEITWDGPESVDDGAVTSAGAGACGGGNKTRLSSEERRGASICEHIRQRSRCKECGGASVCEHKRLRSECKECGGTSICQHNRTRRMCKQCGGASICEHHRQRSKCHQCGGASICEHKRRRRLCKECGGAGICQHNRERSRCKECGGASICEHSRLRSQCKECGGASICKHSRQRSRCKECGGASFCQHKRRKSECKECGGVSICQHKRRRSRCKKCKADKDESMPPDLEEL